MVYAMKGIFCMVLLKACSAQLNSILETNSNSSTTLRRPGDINLVIRAGEVFNLTLHPDIFLWNLTEDNFRADYIIRGRTLLNPVLPAWIKYTYVQQHSHGLLYGVPVYQGLENIEIAVMNTQTFNSGILRINLTILPQPRPSNYSVRLKIEHLNLEDILLVPARLEKLLNVFRNSLWLGSYADLRIIFIDSALNLGARNPIEESSKEGVVLKLGSSSPHSTRLEDLERETGPLRRLATCSFKRTSEERIFRSAGFIIDWCFFRIFNESESSNIFIPKIHRTEKRRFHDRTGIRRSTNLSMIICLTLPLALFLLVSGSLIYIFWRKSSTEDQHFSIFLKYLLLVVQKSVLSKETKLFNPKVDNVKGNYGSDSSNLNFSIIDLRHTRASSVQRQTDTLKSLGRRRDITPRLQSGTDTGSIISRSRTTSPAPTHTIPDLHPTLRSSSYGWDEFMELSSRPPPPPYSPQPTSPTQYLK